jgi:hypothetical protein
MIPGMSRVRLTEGMPGRSAAYVLAIEGFTALCVHGVPYLSA